MRDRFGIFGTVIKLSILLLMMLRIPNRGHGGGNQYQTRGRGGRYRGCPSRGGSPRRGGGRNTVPCDVCGRTHGRNFEHGVFCQVCKKEGHGADRCFKRFDQNYTPPSKSTSSATTSYGVNTNWYLDTGATDHITGELDKLTFRDRYTGGDQVHAANGSSMEIGHIGHGTLQSPTSSLNLHNILHVPQASKSFVSVHLLAHDNNAYLEFHPECFFIKDQQTQKILHIGRCEGGLHPFKSSFNKQGLGITKPSSSMWHSRLGHPSSSIVHQVLSRHSLPFVKDLNNHVCDC